MRKQEIIDCTLRDGGYYTNWNFSSNFFEKYLNAVKSLPISYIELGYISDCKDNLGPFYHLDNKIIQYSKSKIRTDYVLTLDPHPKRVVRWFGDPNYEQNQKGDD